MRKLLTPVEGAAAVVVDAAAADVRRWGTSAAVVGDLPAADRVAMAVEANAQPRVPAPADLRWAEGPFRKIIRDPPAALARLALAREATVHPADDLASQAPPGDQAVRRSAVDRR